MFDWFAWWNLPFWIPLIPSAVLLLLPFTRRVRGRKIEVASHGDSHDGASLDRAHDFDPAFGSRGDVTSDRFFEVHGSQGMFVEFLGGGRVPLIQIAALFLLWWGSSGLVFNKLLQIGLHEPWAFVWISISSAFLAAAILTRLTGKWIWKQTAISEIQKRTGDALIGCKGGAIYKITLESGMAEVYDHKGKLHRVYCRIEPEGNVIQEGDRVLIVGYDSGENLYLVKQGPLF